MTPVELVEVGPRDGLQDEPTVLATDVKVGLVRRLAAAGVRRVEATSFAHPRRVPQLADAEALLAGLAGLPADVRLSALVLNDRGLDRAVATGVPEVTTVVLATDSFSLRNQGMDTAAAVAMAQAVTRRAVREDLAAGVTISAAFGCPFEGDVPAARVLELADRLVEAGPCEVVLADTIGTGHPEEVAALVTAVRARTGLAVRGHFHDTCGRGLANALAAVDAGAAALDAALAGTGGCPTTSGTDTGVGRGNLATEQLVRALHPRGHLTGVDVAALDEAALWLRAQLAAAAPVERLVGSPA